MINSSVNQLGFVYDDCFPCFFCKSKNMIAIDDSHCCLLCGASSEYGHAEIVLKVRQRLHISREELAELYGCEIGTIKKYEYCKPSKRYFDWFLSTIRSLII